MLTANEKPLFSLGGWPVYITPSTPISIIGFLIVSTVIVLATSDLNAINAIITGLLLTLAHWFIGLMHHYGHKLGADTTGHPSSGVKLWGLIGTTLYPADEGDLPAGVHIRRALGGPIFSAVMAVPFGILAALLWDSGQMAQIVLGFALFDSLVVFALGALLPASIPAVDFTSDGAVVLRHLRG